MNRRLQTFALVLLLASPLALARDGGASSRRPAYARVTLPGEAASRPASASINDSGVERVIVEFTTPPLSRLDPGARDVRTHQALAARLRDDLAAIDHAASNAKAAPSTIEHEYGLTFSGAAVAASLDAVEALRALPYVKRVVRDTQVHSTMEPGIAAVGADRVWSNFGTRGAGVTVAIVDSGIDYTHPALGGGFGTGFKVVAGHDFVNDDNDPMDDNGHGTHVAGIVAANSSDLLGVAPDATLYAFKVLDHDLTGFQSDILAAIELCADPNGDSDLSDHVHVVNMSLGGQGSPDDPQSTAIDAASDLGVVFVIAAGNNGGWKSIDSPGTAAKAITVGASDGVTSVASFSSGGPVPPTYAIKPEVVAPGVNIRSTWPGGTATILSGTSMAAPHVAGIAALLRALHPQRSSEEIKSAIATTAQPLDAPVMAAGAGIPDAESAASSETFVSPPLLDFGIADNSLARWSSRRRLIIRNASSETISYSIRTTGPISGVAIFFSSSSLTLQPGESGDVDVTARVDTTVAGFPQDDSLSFGGTIMITGGARVLRVPWAVVKGLSLRVDWTGDENVIAIFSRADGRSNYLDPVQERTFQEIVSPGNYNLYLIALATTGGPTSFLAYENLQLATDRTFLASSGNAPFTISFDATDESGRPFEPGTERAADCTRTRSIVLPGLPPPVADLLLGDSNAFRTSALSERIVILGNDLCVDESKLRLYNVQYEAVRGVSTNLVRIAGGRNLVGQPIELLLPSTTDGRGTIAVETLLRRSGIPLRGSISRSFPWELPSWHGTLFLTPRPEPEFEFPTRIVASESGNASSTSKVESKLIHYGDDGVSCFDSRTPPATTYVAAPGEPLVLGRASIIPVLSIGRGTPSIASVHFAGGLDEMVSPASMSISLLTKAGVPLATGRDSIAIADLTERLRITVKADSQDIDGVDASTFSSSSTGATTADPVPPTLTSMILLDGAGRRIVDRAVLGSSPRIRFSAIDDATATVRARVRYRRGDLTTWQEVPVTIAGEDPPNGGQNDVARGTIFEGSLAQLASVEGLYDLWLIVEDGAGNESSTQLTPALSIVSERKRPIRR